MIQFYRKFLLFADNNNLRLTFIQACIEQIVDDIIIDKFKLTNFTIQLGDVREMHGFDGIIGNDFLTSTIWKFGIAK